MSEVRKRQVLYTVLSPVIQGDTLWQVMCHWQTHYADKAQYEWNAFLSDCQRMADIGGQRTQLYRQLIALMLDSNARLRDDPWPAMQQFQKRQPLPEALNPAADALTSQTLAADDWGPVLTLVLAELFAQLRSDTIVVVKRYAIDMAGRHRLPSSLTYAFTQWLDQGKAMSLPAVPLAQLQQLFNYIYVALCECLGPIVADRMISQAVAVQSEQAPLLNARRLLG